MPNIRHVPKQYICQKQKEIDRKVKLIVRVISESPVNSEDR